MDSKCLVAFYVLLSLIESGNCLHCYSCNVSSSTIDEAGCSGIGSLNGCAGGSVCLAATYGINSGIVKTYATMQSCFPDMAGAECDNFFKTQKNLHASAVLTRNSCYVCVSDNCNKKPRPRIDVTGGGGGGTSYSETGVIKAVFLTLFSLLVSRLVLV